MQPVTNHSLSVLQKPAPGMHILRFRGDTETFTLTIPNPEKGSAWIRTNIGQAKHIRSEIIRKIIHNEQGLGRDWFDIPMKQIDDLTFQIQIPLCEVGHFEAKCFFLKKEYNIPAWPKGPNITINVDPAETCCANIIYNAFVRQFGPNKNGALTDILKDPSIKKLDKKRFTVIPPSGTFRDLIKELDFIIGKLGCRIIQLLPVHPTPTTYARMGRFGSPFAALGFTAIDTALAEFDPMATPLEQFIELVDAIHTKSAKIILDFVVNHTGWGARLHETHPEWLVRSQDGRIKVPGAWGVSWEDLTSLDYSKKELWIHIAKRFLTWCNRGVDGFRCDAGYMIPIPAWKYIVAKVRDQYPNTIFFLEGLGGKISVTRDILNHGNFNWAYSELFQNFSQEQIETYLPKAINISEKEGLLVNFAETHDNKRLAARSHIYAKMRTALCALSSPNGTFGFANGVEWFATDRIDVHESNSLNWGSKQNQIRIIRRLTSILKNHPAFFDQTEIRIIHKIKGNFIVLQRRHLPSNKTLLVVVNLDDTNETPAHWDFEDKRKNSAKTDSHIFVDLITKKEITTHISNKHYFFLLSPGQVLCLSTDKNDLTITANPSSEKNRIPNRITNQCLKAKAMEVFTFYNGLQDIGNFDPDIAAKEIAIDPKKFCSSLNHHSNEPRVITWQWPKDTRRIVMIPPNHFLLICSDSSFRAKIIKNEKVISNEESLPAKNGTYFALFLPLPHSKNHTEYILKLSIYTPKKCSHAEARLLLLSNAKNVVVKNSFGSTDLAGNLLLLGTNGSGSMLRARACWGELKSRYDAFLAGNMSPDIPEDRRIMFTRCRAWVVYQGYSREINKDCLHAFNVNSEASMGTWDFFVPTGQGEHIFLTIGLEISTIKNAVRITFYRHSEGSNNRRLNDNNPVKLILRPDIEDRNFHETTKAYTGPEHAFPNAVTQLRDGFIFTPDSSRQLYVKLENSNFISEPEWQYMVYRSDDAVRGLDPDSDLFSPGYFTFFIKGSTRCEMTAQISHSSKQNIPPFKNISHDIPTSFTDANLSANPLEKLFKTLGKFVVKRGDLQSIIAGYPWFLDWGRDSLIFVRGLIAANRINTAHQIIKQFGIFEEKGTIPNMIQKDNTNNKNTSDAPLWFITACSDLVHAEGNSRFLETDCKGRTIREILFSIGRSFQTGTPSGVIMDPESGLIFSPGHFTWMDTNHPAGTPREGYPIEIQALWLAALSFFNKIDPSGTQGNWEKLAKMVKKSIADLFIIKGQDFLSDCLHAHAGESAQNARADDALRPNQLFAVTLNAVTEPVICRRILMSCEELLVPGAIRSLADRQVKYPAHIIHNGKALNDPHHPYQGEYKGNEDTERKPAYHNGTAWTWLFPIFCEAWVKTFGKKGKNTALAWLSSSTILMDQGCVGHIPEILDGNCPHTQRGCDAQAWGTSELLRVWKQMEAI